MKIKFTILGLMFVFAASLVSAQETTVWPNTYITIESGATLDIKEGNLVLKSDASGDASLIDIGSITFGGGGETQVQRYLTEGQWHLLSSPVSNSLSGMFLGDYLQRHTESSNGWTDISRTITI
ncbi:MAG: hypothetical protein R2750_09640 [Bacteroidales bacterium]